MKSLSKNDRLLLDAVLTNNSDVIESLLTMGANPNHLFNDDGGISPFHIIVGFEDLDLIKLFLENNADVNLSCNNLGWTPMHVCAYWDKPDALKLLLEQNQADPFKQCNNQKTVLETAIQNNSKSCIAVIEEYFRNRNNGQKKVQTVNKSSDNQIESHSYRLPHISNHFNQTELDANQISMDETQIQNKTVVISSNDDPDCLPFKSVQHSQSKKDEMREFHPPNNSHSYTNNLTPKKSIETQTTSQCVVMKKRDLVDSLHESPEHVKNETNQINVVSSIKQWLINRFASPILDRTATNDFQAELDKNHRETLRQSYESNRSRTGSKSINLRQPRASSLTAPVSRNYIHESKSTGDVIKKKNQRRESSLKHPSSHRKPFAPVAPITPVESFFDFKKNLQDAYSNSSSSIHVDSDYSDNTLENAFHDENFFTSDNSDELNISDCRSTSTKIENFQTSSDGLNCLTNKMSQVKIQEVNHKLAKYSSTKVNENKSNLKCNKKSAKCSKSKGNEPTQEGYSKELILQLENRLNLTTTSDIMVSNMFECFADSPASGGQKEWREGHTKSAFNYVLIDPRVSHNLPSRAKLGMDQSEILRTFVDSIFYIGKGSRARPYAHLHDTVKVWNTDTQLSSPCDKMPKKTKKISKIIEIWQENLGVVSLHIFQSVIPCEAYTREAAMIDAIGIHNLTNVKKGNYYGSAKNWKFEYKCKLGAILLKKACAIFLAEGERQIKPEDI